MLKIYYGNQPVHLIEQIDKILWISIVYKLNLTKILNFSMKVRSPGHPIRWQLIIIYLSSTFNNVYVFSNTYKVNRFRYKFAISCFTVYIYLRMYICILIRWGCLSWHKNTLPYLKRKRKTKSHLKVKWIFYLVTKEYSPFDVQYIIEIYR